MSGTAVSKNIRIKAIAESIAVTVSALTSTFLVVAALEPVLNVLSITTSLNKNIFVRNLHEIKKVLSIMLRT